MSGTAVTVRQEYGDNGQVDRQRQSINAAINDLALDVPLNITHVAAGSVNAGETDLMSYTVAASKLASAGNVINVKVWGTTANNANAKTLKVYWGGVAVHTVSLTVSIAGRWVAEFQVIKTGASTQDWFSQIYEQTAAMVAGKGALDVGTGTATDTATIVAKVTGTATTTNDIVAEGMTVTFVPTATELTAFQVNTYDG